MLSVDEPTRMKTPWLIKTNDQLIIGFGLWWRRFNLLAFINRSYFKILLYKFLHYMQIHISCVAHVHGM